MLFPCVADDASSEVEPLLRPLPSVPLARLQTPGGVSLMCCVIAVAILSVLTMWVLGKFRSVWELRIREWLFDQNQVCWLVSPVRQP